MHPSSHTQYCILQLHRGHMVAGIKSLKCSRVKCNRHLKSQKTQNFGPLQALVKNAQQDLILAVMQMCLPSFVPGWQQGNPHFADNRSVVPGRAVNGLFR